MKPRQITVLTWNIRHGRGTDGRTDIGRVAGLIATVRPDIVSLQEVDRHQARSGGVDQVAFLAEVLKMSAAYCPTLPSERYGHALFVRGEIVAQRFTHFCSWKRREPRAFIEATVRTAHGIHARLFSTHLGLFKRERHTQVEALTEAANEPTSAELTLLMGDFNAPSYSRTIRRLKHAFADTRDIFLASRPSERTPLEVAKRKLSSRTWPSSFPLRRLDYVLAREQVEVAQHSVLRTGFRTASDHLPVLVKLRITPEVC